jgi:hypothetical protein
MHYYSVARWDGHRHGCTILIWRRLRNCILFGMLLFSHCFFLWNMTFLTWYQSSGFRHRLLWLDLQEIFQTPGSWLRWQFKCNLWMGEESRNSGSSIRYAGLRNICSGAWSSLFGDRGSLSILLPYFYDFWNLLIVSALRSFDLTIGTASSTHRWLRYWGPPADSSDSKPLKQSKSKASDTPILSTFSAPSEANLYSIHGISFNLGINLYKVPFFESVPSSYANHQNIISSHNFSTTSGNLVNIVTKKLPEARKAINSTLLIHYKSCFQAVEWHLELVEPGILEAMMDVTTVMEA